LSREEEIPPTRTVFDLLTRIDNLLVIQIEASRRTNELLEMLLGIRPVPPEVVVVPAPPAVPVPPVPPVPDLKAIREILDRIEEILKPVTDYLSEETSPPQFYDLEKEIHRPAVNGFIVNDSAADDLEVKINRRETIRVGPGEVLDFNVYFKRPLEINYVEITGAANYRILLW